MAERRVDYTEACYSALGFPLEAAKQHALLVYTVYSGMLRLPREAPNRIYARYREYLKCILIP